MWRAVNKKGFTLVELLVVTSILGMIILAISSTFAGGLNVYKRVQNYSGAQTDALVSLEKIEKDLRNLFSFSGIGFTGNAEKVAFPGLIKEFDSAENQNITLGRISYYFDKKAGALIKEEQNYHQAISEETPGKNNIRVLAYIQSLNFNYYSINPDTKEYSWKGSWAKEEGVPLGVRIEVVFKNGKRDVKLVRPVLIPISD